MSLAVAVTVPVFLISAATGVFAAETRRRTILALFKPLTTILLLPIVGWPHSTFSWLVVVGVLFSLGGDVALLSSAKTAFLAGLSLFLVAHLAYIAAFVGIARGLANGSPAAPSSGLTALPAVAAALVMLVATALLLRKIWPGGAGLRPALVGYALALAAMVVSAVAAVDWGGGPGAGVAGAARLGLSPAAAAGAALFYVSDASLALDRFSRPLKHAPLLTLGLYWLGQLGIAVAARLAS